MKWILQFLTSSIGQKLIMSLTGLFLILFLTVHLIGNLALLKSDGGAAFNAYSDFMGHNPLIQIISKGNFFFIFLHAIQGILLYFKNKGAKGSKYAGKAKDKTTWASKNMALLGTLILAFILMHLGHFYVRFKFFNDMPTVSLDGVEILNSYQTVAEVFSNPIWIVCYLVGLLALAFHLLHGFSSAFQTMGLNHKKYTPIIKALGTGYAILIPLGFAIIPLYMYFIK